MNLVACCVMLHAWCCMRNWHCPWHGMACCVTWQDMLCNMVCYWYAGTALSECATISACHSTDWHAVACLAAWHDTAWHMACAHDQAWQSMYHSDAWPGALYILQGKVPTCMSLIETGECCIPTTGDSALERQNSKLQEAQPNLVRH